MNITLVTNTFRFSNHGKGYVEYFTTFKSLQDTAEQLAEWVIDQEWSDVSLREAYKTDDEGDEEYLPVVDVNWIEKKANELIPEILEGRRE